MTGSMLITGKRLGPTVLNFPPPQLLDQELVRDVVEELSRQKSSPTPISGNIEFLESWLSNLSGLENPKTVEKSTEKFTEKSTGRTAEKSK